MKKMIFILSLIFFIACTNQEIKKNYKNIGENEINKIENLVAYELENKIKLYWDLKNNEDIENIIIEIKEENGKIEKKLLNKKDRECEIETVPSKKMEITVKVLRKNGKISEGKQIIAEAKMSLLVKDEDKYINLNSNKIKILFKATSNSKVKLYLGEREDNLNLIRTTTTYSGDEGFEIGGLVPGKEYFYKITAEKKDKIFESKIISFVKIDLYQSLEKSDWPKKSIFYEINLKKYSDSDKDNIGDLKGLIEKMPHLRELDIDAILLMPVFSLENYYQIRKEYGTIEDFDKLIKTANKNGIKIIMDFIVDYSSKESEWFRKSFQDRNSIYRDYYIWKDEFNHNNKENWYGNDEKYYSKISENLPDFNLKNPRVRDEIKKASKFWMNKGVAGFRIKESENPDEIKESFRKELYSFIKSENSEFFILGEKEYKKTEFNINLFYRFDSYFDYELNKKIIETVKNETEGLSDYIVKKRADNVIERKLNGNSIFLSNRDMPRVSMDIKDKKKEKLVVSIFFTSPGIPFIYYGDEFSHKDESNLVWDKAKKSEKDIFEYYKKLIKIRKDNPCIFDGLYIKREAEKGLEAYDIYENENRSYKIQVVHNLSSENKSFKIQAEDYVKGEELLHEKTLEKFCFELEPYESIIIKYEK